MSVNEDLFISVKGCPDERQLNNETNHLHYWICERLSPLPAARIQLPRESC
ncbi:hypothetical protein KOR42_54530 [Thalassoglobus neptunius]|uniref:Uncharacterized protein n=1 Tax=Thalassoglobus neptunius TaxID=1938619 RepID=A0A5C5UYK1_9PLAN|nr:hypothetical protein KOR42_54530 [Thalassoglobus neptunius]